MNPNTTEGIYYAKLELYKDDTSCVSLSQESTVATTVSADGSDMYSLSFRGSSLSVRISNTMKGIGFYNASAWFNNSFYLKVNQNMYYSFDIPSGQCTTASFDFEGEQVSMSFKVHWGTREVSSGYVAEMAWWSDQANTTATGPMSRWVARSAAPVVLANIGVCIMPICDGTTAGGTWELYANNDCSGSAQLTTHLEDGGTYTGTLLNYTNQTTGAISSYIGQIRCLSAVTLERPRDRVGMCLV